MPKKAAKKKLKRKVSEKGDKKSVDSRKQSATAVRHLKSA